eukprot:TRINITY_DN45502_c0_g1_i1.p1 TRINITY_DN45502_c0_g1~~TRINITY_DN45502_c0_g1_i1.p1  ORF type:complete len:529 (+),score=173.29 TRINITY_DN45502_c0_g1_i1:52-1638(+)
MTNRRHKGRGGAAPCLHAAYDLDAACRRGAITAAQYAARQYREREAIELDGGSVAAALAEEARWLRAALAREVDEAHRESSKIAEQEKLAEDTDDEELQRELEAARKAVLEATLEAVSPEGQDQDLEFQRVATERVAKDLSDLERRLAEAEDEIDMDASTVGATPARVAEEQALDAAGEKPADDGDERPAAAQGEEQEDVAQEQEAQPPPPPPPDSDELAMPSEDLVAVEEHLPRRPELSTPRKAKQGDQPPPEEPESDRPAADEAKHAATEEGPGEAPEAESPGGHSAGGDDSDSSPQSDKHDVPHCLNELTAARVSHDIGKLEFAVEAMQWHLDSAAVQREACAAISSLVRKPRHRTIVIEAGGIAAIVSSMEAHRDSACVQKYACAALLVLAEEEGSKHSEKVTETGGITAAIEAMKAHGDDAQVQEEACHLVACCAVTAKTIAKVAAAGGALAVSAAMQRHADTAKIQEWGCFALATLASSSARLAVKVATAGGREVVQAAIQRHPKSEWVQFWGTRTLEQTRS